MNDTQNQYYRGSWVSKELQDAWLDGRLTGKELLLYLVIDSFMTHGQNGKRCSLSNSFLAEKIKSSPNSISNMISRLVKKGFVERYFENETDRFLVIVPNPPVNQ